MRTVSLFLASLALCLNSLARADESDRASFGLQFSLLQLSTGQQHLQTLTEDTKKTITEWKSSNLIDASTWLKVDKMSFYIYPFQDNNAFFSLGYQLLDTLEVGLDAGYNSQRIKTSDQTQASKDQLLGLYFVHTAQLPKFDIETNVIYDRVDGLSGAQSSAESDTKRQGSFTKLSFSAVIPLRSNASYVGGIAYSLASQKTGSDKESIASFTTQIFGLRFVL